jgi:acetyl esterase/lipase
MKLLLRFGFLSFASVCAAAAPATPRTIFGQMPDAARAEYEHTSVRLWEGAAPGAKGEAAEDVPRLYPLARPAAATGPVAVILVFPGGGYNNHAAHEAFPIAEYFRGAGMAAFVLKYRLKPYSEAVSLQDAQRAVRLVRARSAEFGVDPTRIAAIGFSAGGHLAANLSTHADDGRRDATDPIERASARLQTALLIYPWLVFEPVRSSAAARMPLPGVLRLNGLHQAVDARTPPTFLLVGYDDDRTPYEHSLAYTAKLHEAGTRFELHVLGTGGHGFGMRGTDARLQPWPQLAANWLVTCKFLPPKTAAAVTP